MQQIKDIKKAIDARQSPMKYKKTLAFEIVRELNTKIDAIKAQGNFERVVQGKETPKDMQVYMYTGRRYENITNLLVQLGLAESKSEAKRLVEQKGVTIDSQTIIDPNMQIEVKNDIIIKVGKRKFVKIKLDTRR